MGQMLTPSTVRQMLLLSAIAVYKESPVTSARAVGLRLLLLSCAGAAVFGCTSSVWLAMDTLLARANGSADPWPTAIMSSVAWVTASVGSLPVTRHCCSCEVWTRASETMAAGS